MGADSGVDIKELRVDGGAAANNTLLQFQADILAVPVVRPTILETTALGAAYLAGLAVGYWNGYDDIQHQWQVDKTFKPTMDREQVADLNRYWQKALGRAKGWLDS